MRLSHPNEQSGRGAILALGFGTTVAMWMVAYICRFPSVMAPGWLLVLLLLFCLFGGGQVAGTRTPRGWRAGLETGVLASLLNLLILGSLLTGPDPNRVAPSALLWIPGSIVAGALLGTMGALIGSINRPGDLVPANWTGVFAAVAAAATLLLLIVGGIVTGQQAGLAVVDWPNSFGYNMFLYPLARMSGDIFYEHAHRLFGSLVGLTTLVLTVHLKRRDGREWVSRFAFLALLLVIVQGLLGGLRVTGRFTLSATPAGTTPNILLAITHGVVGQIFFGMMVALAVFTSSLWRSAGVPPSRPSVSTDRGLNSLLIVLLIVQILLGAVQRHIAGGLYIHIVLAVVVVAVGIAAGARAWGIYEEVRPLKRTGLSLLVLTGLQIFLGFAALIAVGGFSPDPGPPSAMDVTLTTIHQAVGALLLAHAVALLIWFHRLVVPTAPPPTGDRPA